MKKSGAGTWKLMLWHTYTHKLLETDTEKQDEH